MKFSELIIKSKDHTIKSVLEYINKLAISQVVLFAIDEHQKLIGTVNEGDIRRSMLNGNGFDSKIEICVNKNCRFLSVSADNFDVFNKSKEQGIRFLPMLDRENRILKIIDSSNYLDYVPFEVVLMAGGKGERLMPLTEKTPKPLLKVGEKAIIDYNVERLIKFGVERFHITLGYLGKQIEQHLNEKFGTQVSFEYYYENSPRGTAGSLSEIKISQPIPVLFMNCDLLTNIDYGDMFRKFISEKCDLMVASIEYHVEIPYAVFEFNSNNTIKNLSEKPKYTYETNAGIYLLNSSLLSGIPKEGKYDATDFLEELMKSGRNVKSFLLTNYWLDIGRHDDFNKAQRDVTYIKFDE
jgi:dTDP-glucose pyrophosphorylase/CBS domain-containing protein